MNRGSQEQRQPHKRRSNETGGLLGSAHQQKRRAQVHPLQQEAVVVSDRDKEENMERGRHGFGGRTSDGLRRDRSPPRDDRLLRRRKSPTRGYGGGAGSGYGTPAKDERRHEVPPQRGYGGPMKDKRMGVDCCEHARENAKLEENKKEFEKDYAEYERWRKGWIRENVEQMLKLREENGRLKEEQKSMREKMRNLETGNGMTDSQPDYAGQDRVKDSQEIARLKKDLEEMTAQLAQLAARESEWKEKEEDLMLADNKRVAEENEKALETLDTLKGVEAELADAKEKEGQLEKDLEEVKGQLTKKEQEWTQRELHIEVELKERGEEIERLEEEATKRQSRLRHASIVKKELQKLQAREAQLQEDVNLAEQQAADERRQSFDLSQKLEESEQKLEESEEKLASATEEMAKMTEEIARLTTANENHVSDNSKLNEEVARLNGLQEKPDSDNSKLTEEIARLTTANEKHVSDGSKLTDEVVRLSGLYEKSEQEAESLKFRAEHAECQLDAKVSEQQTEMIRLETEVQELSSQIEQLEKEAQAQAARSSSTEADLLEKVAELEEQLKKKSDDVDFVMEEVAKRENNLSIHAAELERLNGELAAASQQCVQLAEEKDQTARYRQKELRALKETHEMQLQQLQKLKSSKEADIVALKTQLEARESEMLELKKTHEEQKDALRSSSEEMQSLRTTHELMQQQRDELQVEVKKMEKEVERWRKCYSKEQGLKRHNDVPSASQSAPLLIPMANRQPPCTPMRASRPPHRVVPQSVPARQAGGHAAMLLAAGGTPGRRVAAPAPRPPTLQLQQARGPTRQPSWTQLQPNVQGGPGPDPFFFDQQFPMQGFQQGFQSPIRPQQGFQQGFQSPIPPQQGFQSPIRPHQRFQSPIRPQQGFQMMQSPYHNLPRPSYYQDPNGGPNWGGGY